jgi:hypothetical protein
VKIASLFENKKNIISQNVICLKENSAQIECNATIFYLDDHHSGQFACIFRDLSSIEKLKQKTIRAKDGNEIILSKLFPQTFLRIDSSIINSCSILCFRLKHIDSISRSDCFQKKLSIIREVNKIVDDNQHIYFYSSHQNILFFLAYHIGDEIEHAIDVIETSFHIKTVIEQNSSFSSAQYIIVLHSGGPFYLKLCEKSGRQFFYSSGIMELAEKMCYLDTQKKIILSPQIYKIIASRSYLFEMGKDKTFGQYFSMIPKDNKIK